MKICKDLLILLKEDKQAEKPFGSMWELQNLWYLKVNS